jgi:hypothetical protein
MDWKFWALQDPGDKEPYGVVARDPKGLARMFVPGEGLVDAPWAAGWVLWGEPGKREISKAEAKRLMSAGVGKLTPQDVVTMKGTAPTVPIPM